MWHPPLAYVSQPPRSRRPISNQRSSSWLTRCVSQTLISSTSSFCYKICPKKKLLQKSAIKKMSPLTCPTMDLIFFYFLVGRNNFPALMYDVNVFHLDLRDWIHSAADAWLADWINIQVHRCSSWRRCSLHSYNPLSDYVSFYRQTDRA